jgi:hypothetical protein
VGETHVCTMNVIVSYPISGTSHEAGSYIYTNIRSLLNASVYNERYLINVILMDLNVYLIEGTPRGILMAMLNYGLTRLSVDCFT